MYFNDHGPPHFHVQYGEYRATVGIETVAIAEGELPPRVTGLVVEWANLHRPELMKNWQTIRKSGAWMRIEPLV